MKRHPIGFRLRHLPNPAAQIGADVFHFRLPHARDRRRQIVLIFRSHSVEHAVGDVVNRRPPHGSDRQQLLFFQFAKELELHRMEQSAASERIHLLQRKSGFARS